MDAGFNFTYTSCPDKKEASPYLWSPKQPDNSRGAENCVAINFPNSKWFIGYSDVHCNSDYLALCEVIKDTKLFNF
jgi:hypothetical protein